ncbi:PCMD domain-containing protein [Chryseobacterium sp. MEBOG06]|uniref:PCMD domain-containing protein n=1 Tax=Chryseobacterium sp. MEBOG06 TaxID=2879938 RepID=UPI001F294596|nr:PCMD domain-containing protein [Chryseobacterium sp. MEBOG06]UKB82186.1 PCMD domain-containing protein [Chryseobacterium sp. MEBOG06]
MKTGFSEPGLVFIPSPMKNISYILLFLSSFLFLSCIQAELPNAEADILSCSVDPDILRKDPIIQNDRIQILVKSSTDLTQQAPVFTLTPGAAIFPASGTVLNFTKPQTYTVTSEDHQSQKKYEVSYVISTIGSKFSFEQVRLENGKFDVFFETDQNNHNIMDWASGNLGFALTGASSTPEGYPTARWAEGKVGQAAKLTTQSTGSLGAIMGKPMAAGNLFMGEFDLSASISDPLKSLHLGVPVDLVPKGVKGFFKYKAGPVYKQGGVVQPNKKDTWDIYGVFFETDSNLKYLDGTNKFTHPNIVSIAKVTPAQRIETSEWTSFYIPFDIVNNKTIDPQKLKDGKYNLTLVFTSSIDGDTFAGAEGSTLLIDEIEITH